MDCDWKTGLSILAAGACGYRSGSAFRTDACSFLQEQPRQIEALVRGELMEGYSSMWILPIREFWKEKVKTLTQEAAAMLDQKGQAEAALRLTHWALTLDPYSDDLNYCYLSELVKAREYNRALKHFDQISEQFYHEFGVEFEGRSKSLIYFLSSDREPSHSIQELIDEMNTKEDGSAFYCEQPVFLQIVSGPNAGKQTTGYQLLLTGAGRTKRGHGTGNAGNRRADSDCQDAAALLRHIHPHGKLSAGCDVDDESRK